MQTPIQFFAGTDLVVVGHDNEMADYDNPRGEIIRSAAYIYAEDVKGYRVCKHVGTGWEQEVLPKAEALAFALNNRLKNLGKLPVDYAAWVETRPCYGSEAFVESGQGEEDFLLERMSDEF